MGNKGRCFSGMAFTLIFLILCHVPNLHAQKASAEFISSFAPTTLNTGQPVKDGIQKVCYVNNLLYVEMIKAQTNLEIEASVILNIYNLNKISYLVKLGFDSICLATEINKDFDPNHPEKIQTKSMVSRLGVSTLLRLLIDGIRGR